MVSRNVAGRWGLLATSAALLAGYALHHGSYSLVDRQTPAVFLWGAIAAGAVFGWLPAARPTRVVWAALASLGAMAAWILIGLSWTESSERTIDEFTRLVGYAGVLVLIWISIRRSTWRLVAAGMLAAGVAVCALILLSRLSPELFPRDTIARAFGKTRINYPFGYWNSVGCWSAMTITLCLAWAGHARSALVRGAALAAVPMCVLALYFALSRAGVGGALAGSVLVVLLGRNRWLTFLQTAVALAASLAVLLIARKQYELVYANGTSGATRLSLALLAASAVCAAVAFAAARLDLGARMRMAPRLGRVLGVAGCVLAVLVVAAAAATHGNQALKEFQGKKLPPTVQNGDERLAALNGNRHNIWASAWDAFEAKPATGLGAGTFEFWWARNGVNGEFVRDAHNIYLEALAEQGVVGLFLLLLFFAALLLAGLRARSSLGSDESAGVIGGLIAAFCVFALQAGVDWMWESTAIAVFALTAIAVAAAAASEPWARPRSLQLTTALAVGSIAAIATLLPGLSRAHYVDSSTAAARGGDYALAIEQANKATQAAPWSAGAYAQRALAKEKSGDLRGAAADIRAAERKEPTNWRWPLIATRIAAARGQTAAALAAYRRARALYKYAKVFGVKSPPIR